MQENHFLLLKKFKNTGSAQLWTSQIQRRIMSFSLNSEDKSPICRIERVQCFEDRREGKKHRNVQPEAQPRLRSRRDRQLLDQAESCPRSRLLLSLEARFLKISSVGIPTYSGVKTGF